MGLQQVFPCSKVQIGKPFEQWEFCQNYLNLPLTVPRSKCDTYKVPRVYTAVGKGEVPSGPVVMNAAANPSFKLEYYSDKEARAFIMENCGSTAGAAYDCFIAPAYRADLFRFCKLYADGGVYLDTDLILTTKIEDSVSMCSDITIGYDLAYAPTISKRTKKIADPIERTLLMDGKQMKILAARPGHPLIKCMLSRIVENVQRRWLPRYPLMLTGPQLLQTCYDMYQNNGSVDITYRDTRGAMWPFSGMMGASGLLAFERPSNLDYGSRKGSEKELHYHDLFLEGVVFTNSCAVPTSNDLQGTEPHWFVDAVEKTKQKTQRLNPRVIGYKKKVLDTAKEAELQSAREYYRMRLGSGFDSLPDHPSKCVNSVLQGVKGWSDSRCGRIVCHLAGGGKVQLLRGDTLLLRNFRL